MITKKQKKALEKITGKSWDTFPMKVVGSYFLFTDRGIKDDLFKKVWKLQLPNFRFNKVEQALWDLMQSHTFHPVAVEMWKEDFKSGLLFLSDFVNKGYPEAYIKHASEIYANQ